MIKDFHVDFDGGMLCACVMLNCCERYIYFKTDDPAADGEAFLSAVRAVTSDPGGLLYFDGVTIQSAGNPPSQHHIFDYTTKQWVDPRTPETEWSLVRQKRNQLLLASDWTQLPDAPAASKAQWAAYRQALRDITEQPDPFSVVWPSPPAQ